MVAGVLCSWNAVTDRVNEFYAWLLVLQTGMLGVFLAFDIVLFYVFFELSLVPLFFLIGIWGGPERQYAARKFFVYTLAGSLITLLGVLGVVLSLGQPLDPEKETSDRITFSIPKLVELSNVRSRTVADSATARCASKPPTSPTMPTRKRSWPAPRSASITGARCSSGSSFR